MTRYVDRFEAMVREIAAHPQLEVVSFKVNPPVTPDAIRAVEERLGAPLAPAIRAFYEEADGLYLHWKLKPDLPPDEWDALAELCDDCNIESSESTDIPMARINLLPIAEALVTRKWNELSLAEEDETAELRGRTYPARELERRLRPFDAFSTYECMAFVTEPGDGNPPAMLLGDYYIEWDESRLTDFASYLEFLLATRGISNARRRLYNQYRGDLEPPLVTGSEFFTEEWTPKLFRRR